MNPAQPPEGILDPQQPYWPADRVGEITWLRLKGKLTGRRVEGLSENFTSYVKLGDADADRLIANIKKWGKYPQVNQNDKYGGAYNNEAYQKWLVEEFLEKPFREETNKKIEEAEQEARLKEIKEQKEKDKKSVPLPPISPKEEEKKIEEEQKVLDDDQQSIETETTKITTELDSVEKQENKQQNPPEDTSSQQEESNKLNNDIESISDALVTIKGSLSNQISNLGSVQQDLIKASSTLEGIKQLFQVQTDIIRREIDVAEKKASEKSLEQSKVVSATTEATDLTADNKATGVIESVDGPTLTVKTTEGEFKQGQKISQGSGGGLFDMLSGIAGKFLTRGKGGGGGSPMKLSAGGFLNTPYPAAYAEGTFTPGIYDKPTRGNLGPGQAVIPLNRNYGKRIFEGNLTQTLKLQQPLADVMAQPLKAIGLSIISVAGNFLRLLGPLAGFFTPYISGLVKGFGAVLGVPVAIISALLGGPAYAAAEDQDKQQNVFAKLWSDLMKKFGFDFGDDEEGNGKNKNSKKPGPGKIIQGGDADFWSLAAVASLEGASPQGEADVAQAVYNRVASGAYSVKTIKDAVLSPGQFQPVTGDGVDISLWRAVKDRETAIAAVAAHKGKGTDTATKYVDEGAANITNPSLQKDAAEWVGGRTDFAVPSAANKYAGGFGYKERHGHLFGWYVGPASIAYGQTNPGPASVPDFKVAAEEGVVIKTRDDSNLGKFLGWSIIEGPNSGYDVGSNLEMHGREAYLQHEYGATILPIENNEYSLSKNPEQTINRWKEILGPKTPPTNGEGSYQGGGRVESGRRHAAKLKAQRAAAQRTRLGVQKVDGRWMNMGVSDQAVGSNPWWQVWNKKGATAERRRKQEALAASLAARLNAQEGNNKPTPAPSGLVNPIARGGRSTPAPVEKKAPSETDLMMERYNQLVAAGKHAEAKELGMQIWNKTYRKTDIGIERIPSTQTQAASSTKPDSRETNIVVPTTPPVVMVPVSGGSAIPQTPAPLPSIQEELEIVNMKSLC